MFCNILPTRNSLNVKQIEVAILVFFQMKGGTLNLCSPWFIFPDSFSPYAANKSDGCAAEKSNHQTKRRLDE